MRSTRHVLLRGQICSDAGSCLVSFVLFYFFSQNALIQDLENCQKQLEEFHHTRVSMALVNHLKTIKKTQLSSCFQRSCLVITGDFLQKYSFLVHVS